MNFPNIGGRCVYIANEIAQVRLGVDKTVTGQLSDRENNGYRHRAKKRNYSPMKLYGKQIKLIPYQDLNLDLTFTRFQALEERLGMKNATELAYFFWTGRCQTAAVSLC